MAQIRSLSCDIESFSSVDLTKAGVYKYAQSDDFEILLFGYSIDGGEVNVVDLANGESIPADVLAALEDDKVIKSAFNANFERVCLSRYLGYETGDYLDPHSWRCTMIWSAYMGLPLSLKGAGAVLGLEKQKLDEGKDLIRYFCVPCKPTKANGGRTRNLPHHAPDKWELFKRYNKRDVETETEIQHKLARFPVPDFVWEEFILDQEINDRGIRIDRQLAQNAIRFDARSREELTAKMKEITELENPNSVMQMKQWLIERGLEVDSLGKKEVAELLKTAPPRLAEVLRLRQRLAKSSVKKYQAMETAVCSDDRARGMFQFYGANRTGRWCLTGDHEILTPDGWIRLDQWNGGNIACWNATTEGVSFQKAESVCFEYTGPLYTYHDSRIDQTSTPDHKMRVQQRYGGEWTDMTVEDMSRCRPSIPLMGYKHQRGCANPAWLRVLIMTQADGFYTTDGSVAYHFKKQRKIERCKHLLRNAEIAFTTKVYVDTTVIKIPARGVPLWLREFRTKTFGFWLLDESPDIFFDELPNWDGYMPASNSIQYSTCNKQNADIVQAMAHMSGRTASMRIKQHAKINPNWNDAYVVDIWLTPKNCHEIRVKPTIEEYSGQVYCAVTKTGYFLVRRNGKVWVTGNSGKIIQLQNLYRNTMPDLEQARSIVRSGDYGTLNLLYDSVPDVLSELIRTAFIPREGCKFVVADFSAVEARVIAWLAGETWITEAFAKGRDIYCETASRMFGVPVVKHGINGHLRQRGKQALLSCQYGGSVGALKAMNALESGMKEDELKPLVDKWRQSNPNIVRFWWAVDKAVKDCVKGRTTTSTHGLTFEYKSGMMFIVLPSGRKLAYVKPRIGENRFGGESVTYEGIGATKKWERIESYGPKFCENCTQAVARDLLMNSIKTLGYCSIVAHVHDEIIIECDKRVSVKAICEQMARVPDWANGLLLRADGYECEFYKKD